MRRYFIISEKHTLVINVQKCRQKKNCRFQFLLFSCSSSLLIILFRLPLRLGRSLAMVSIVLRRSRSFFARNKECVLTAFLSIFLHLAIETGFTKKAFGLWHFTGIETWRCIFCRSRGKHKLTKDWQMQIHFFRTDFPSMTLAWPKPRLIALNK